MGGVGEFDLRETTFLAKSFETLAEGFGCAAQYVSTSCHIFSLVCHIGRWQGVNGVELVGGAHPTNRSRWATAVYGPASGDGWGSIGM